MSVRGSVRERQFTPTWLIAGQEYPRDVVTPKPWAPQPVDWIISLENGMVLGWLTCSVKALGSARYPPLTQQPSLSEHTRPEVPEVREICELPGPKNRLNGNNLSNGGLRDFTYHKKYDLSISFPCLGDVEHFTTLRLGKACCKA